MRCVICDAEEKGLSTFRADGHFTAHHFSMIDGDPHCSECASMIDETISDFYIDNEEEDDEDE